MIQPFYSDISLVESPCTSPRRRSKRCHQSILNAAIEVLEAEGYGGASIEAIARRAGAGKQSIYRRWSSKAALFMEACLTQPFQQLALPDTGSVRGDLVDLLQQLFAILKTTPVSKAITGIIVDAQTDLVVAEAFQTLLNTTHRSIMQAILERGIARGDLRPQLNLELVIDAVYGPVWYRLLLGSGPLDDEFAQALTDLLLVGMRKDCLP
jgi:AcrR family transcriptional regulator